MIVLKGYITIEAKQKLIQWKVSQLSCFLKKSALIEST